MAPPGAGSDRLIIVAQIAAGVLLVIFGACLEAFAGLTATDNISLAVIGVGAALLPSGAAASASARILQGLPSRAAADLDFIDLQATTAHPGDSVAGFVFLTSPAPTGGFTITLSASDTTVAIVPASLTIAAGSAAGGFTVATTDKTPLGAVTITASGGTTNKQVSLQVAN